jgi:hypothetical protein
VVAYLYSSPHEVFDSLFVYPEEASLVLFKPDRVSVHLARPAHHTEAVSATALPAPDQFSYVPGYRGLYNFRHAFWMEKGAASMGRSRT